MSCEPCRRLQSSWWRSVWAQASHPPCGTKDLWEAKRVELPLVSGLPAWSCRPPPAPWLVLGGLFHGRVPRQHRSCLCAIAAAPGAGRGRWLRPLALINGGQGEQAEAWDGDRTGIGLGPRTEGGIWCSCALGCDIWRAVGAGRTCGRASLRRAHHVLRPGGCGLAFPPPESPLRGLLH